MFTETKTRARRLLKVGRRHWTLAEVVFGSPKKRCAGVGICTMNPLNQAPGNNKFPCQKVIAQLMLTDEKTLALRLVKDDLCAQIANRQFPQHKFILKQTFKLPDTLCEELDIQSSSISAGNHLVEETEGSYIIHLSLA
mgnify:CR=1 FL=1